MNISDHLRRFLVTFVGLLVGVGCSSAPEASKQNTQGAGLTAGQTKVVPILECVRSLPSGFAAQLGYDNTSGATQSLVVGANNGFGLPEPEDDLGQPISFAAGRQRNVFQVPFTTSISYTLGQTTVTATSGSVRCGASQPPPRETFEFHYPQGVALESIVLGQEEALLLQSDARVLPTSAGVFVTAFGNADIRARAQLGSLVAKGQVTVARYSTLAGSLRSEVKPSVSPYATVKGGISLGPVTPRSLNFGIEKRLGGSSGYIGVPKNGRLTLPPGSYGSLEVFDNAEAHASKWPLPFRVLPRLSFG